MSLQKIFYKKSKVLFAVLFCFPQLLAVVTQFPQFLGCFIPWNSHAGWIFPKIPSSRKIFFSKISSSGKILYVYCIEFSMTLALLFVPSFTWFYWTIIGLCTWFYMNLLIPQLTSIRNHVK